MDDIQDGEVYAVEESKHDDGTTARLSVEADGAIVAHLRVPEGCKGGDAIPIVIDTRQLGDPHGGVKHVGDYPCPDDVQPGEVLPILIKEGDGRGMPPPPPEGFEPEKDVVFVTVPAGCREGDDIPILESGVETGLVVKCPPGKKPGDVVGVKVTEEDRKRMKEGADRAGKRLDELQEICHALPVCLNFGGKDVADLLAEEAYYQEQAERTASIANAAKHQRERFEAALAAARKGVKEDKEDKKKKEKRLKQAKERQDTRRKLEAKLAKARRDGDAREVEKYARLVEACKEKVIEEKVSADLIRRSDWEDEASQRQAVEKRLEKYRKAVETAVEKSEKEKDQAKAEKCEAWLAKHDEDSRSYVFKEDEVVQARYRGRELFVEARVVKVRKDNKGTYTYDLEFADVDDDDAKTLDVDQAEKLATRAKQDHDAKYLVAHKTSEKAKRAADDITKLVNKLYRRRALQLHPDRCGGGEEARLRFEKFQISSAVLKDQEKRLLYVGEMTRARDTALREDIDQDLEESERYGKWHDTWLAKHKASLGLEGDAEKVAQKPLRLEAEEALRTPAKVQIVSKVPGKDCLTVTGEVSALSVLAEQFVAAECRVEQSWGYGGFDKAPMTQSIKLEPSHGRHVAQVTFSSLTFGGWELKWRVAVDKNGHQSWSPWSAGAAVDVIDPRADEKDAKRKKASEKCAYEASSLESLLKEAQGWSTLQQEALKPNVDSLERAISRCAQLCRVASREASVPAKRVVAKAMELHSSLEARLMRREQRSERRQFAQLVRRRVWSGAFGAWISTVTKDDLTRENGDVNRLFQSLIGTEKKALVAANWASDDVLDAAATRSDLFSKKNVEALKKCAQQLRDKRRSEEDKERQREIAKARAAKLKQRAAPQQDDDDDFDDAAWDQFMAATAPEPAAAPPAVAAGLQSQDSTLSVKDLECPITYELFKDPVTLEGDGIVYERSAIEQWLRRGHMTSPVTNVTLGAGQTRLIPHEEKKRQAAAARERQAQAPPSPVRVSVPITMPAVVSPPTPPAPAPPTNGHGPLQPCLAEFVASLGLSDHALATLVEQLATAEIFDLETAKFLEAAEWRDVGLKVGTRKRLLAGLEEIA